MLYISFIIFSMKKLIFRSFDVNILVFFITSLAIVSVIVWTIQAINYLDFVTEDGHSLKIYFFFTVFNFPKIVHRILPFIFFISLFFTLINYEIKNELNIFWINGISKIKLVNQIFFLSIAIMLLQIFLGSTISPYTLNKARGFLKESNVDFFSSLLKERKFLAISKGVTIFIEKKNDDSSFKNIFLDDSRKENSKVIIAEKGVLNSIEKNKTLNFDNGKLVDINDIVLKIFEFSEINFLLNNLSSNTVTTPKVQELKNKTIIYCLFENKSIEIDFFKCERQIKNNMIQELIKRTFKPIYIPIIALFCSLLLINIKNKNYQIFVFILTFSLLIISETSLRYSTSSDISLFLYFIIPLLILVITYFYIFKTLKND